MKYTILIGGRAGQGINKISEIITEIVNSFGYYIFNYRDYPSLIRGGHNFNVLTISDKQIGSIEKKIDVLIAMDEKTIKLHKEKLKTKSWLITPKGFEKLGRDLNIAQATAFLKILGIPKKLILKEVTKNFQHQGAKNAVEEGYNSQKENIKLKKLNNKISILTGSQAIAKGAINSKVDRYIAYPMTPSTGVLHEMANKQFNNNFVVFQPENEIAVVNMALGSSFAGARTMIGTAGGGFDLMTEGLSFQGMSEVPLVVYLASRPGPGSGVPTYSTQSDVDIALRAGHGEFPRIVIAPGDPIEAIEKTNESFYLTEKFNTLSIILADKHLAESQYSSHKKENKNIKISQNRNIPGKTIVKSSSYEHKIDGNTTEDAKITKINADNRIKKYKEIKKECAKFEMVKIHGKKNSKNLIIGFGSTKNQILDAIENLDCKFLQVIYLKPMSNKIKTEMKKAKKIILIEQNSTGQLGRLLREKTGISILEKNRILKYDGRPFYLEELKSEIKKRLK